jgi:protein phosphatase methylesterase 1
MSAATIHADTYEFTIIDDAALNSAIAQARSEFLSGKPFTRLDATLLIPDGSGAWRRGSYNPNTLAYPASCVKLPYLAAAMYWCRTNGHPYTYLDASVRPMIEVSDNYATGQVVDIITGAPNLPSVTSSSDPAFLPWYNKRLYTENYLAGRGLLENQTIINKTYPTNSGSSPTGAEAVVSGSYRGGNRMQPKVSASLMLEIVKAKIEPGANAYMTGLLSHDKWGDNSCFGFGLPPGSIYYNKVGVAYDTVEDIAYVRLPNGRELVLAAYSNAYVAPYVNDPLPHDISILGMFCEAVIEKIGLDVGNPPKLKVDNTSATFSLTGSWATASASADKYGSDYRYKSGGTGSASATWNLNVPQTGTYEVCVLYPQGSNRATDAPFTVNHNGGSTLVRINQQQVGGRWVRLGDFNFTAGTGSVVLTDAISNSSRIVVADAVKATKWPGGAGVEDWAAHELTPDDR